MSGPLLETPRLVLRPPRSEDLEGWTALVADPESARFIGGVQPPYGAWIGRVGPWQPAGWPGPEVGWGILRSAWGKGYAVEAAAATMGWAFGTLGWDRAIHLIHPENARSRALAGRLGSRLLGPVSLPPPLDPEPMQLWGQSAQEWMALRNPG